MAAGRWLGGINTLAVGGCPTDAGRGVVKADFSPIELRVAAIGALSLHVLSEGRVIAL